MKSVVLAASVALGSATTYFSESFTSESWKDKWTVGKQNGEVSNPREQAVTHALALAWVKRFVWAWRLGGVVGVVCVLWGSRYHIRAKGEKLPHMWLRSCKLAQGCAVPITHPPTWAPVAHTALRCAVALVCFSCAVNWRRGDERGDTSLLFVSLSVLSPSALRGRALSTTTRPADA